MNIFKMALANIRKRKGANLTFCAMMILSTIVLCCSLALMAGSSGFYEKKVNELNAPHYATFIHSAVFGVQDFTGHAESYQETVATHVYDTVIINGKWQMKTRVNEALIGFFSEHALSQEMEKI